MNVQVIERDGQPEYAVLAWAEYLQLLAEAGRRQPESRAAAEPAAGPVFELARLAEWREARGLSQEQLARAVGISLHYLGMIERGERQPDQAIGRALERHFARPQE